MQILNINVIIKGILYYIQTYSNSLCNKNCYLYLKIDFHNNLLQIPRKDFLCCSVVDSFLCVLEQEFHLYSFKNTISSANSVSLTKFEFTLKLYERRLVEKKRDPSWNENSVLAK